MGETLKILDCTLRDGGLCLEDAYINKMSDLRFSNEDYCLTVNYLKESKMDIIELGSIEITKEDHTGFAIFQSIEEISKIMPIPVDHEQMFVALFRGPDTPVNNIPVWHNGLVRGIRVILRYSELRKSLDFCAALSEKGYKVFIQPMLTLRYTENELKEIVDASNAMKAYALYFVDSYGSMLQKDVDYFYNFYNERLDKNIKIGFHAHNNMNMAFANVTHFIEISHERPIIVDSCILGMGQGAGNLQTELISFFCNNKSNEYNYNCILDACDIIEKYTPKAMWGYSVERLLPALHRAAYKYGMVLRNKYKFSYSEIDHFIKTMPLEAKLRFTRENLEKIISSGGK